MTAPNARYYGYGLGKRSGVRAGAMYPMLSKFLDQGWLKAQWEDATASEGRPRHRYYELTEVGDSSSSSAATASSSWSGRVAS